MMNKKLNKLTKKAEKEKEEARLLKEKNDKRAASNKKSRHIASEVKKYLDKLEEGCLDAANNGKYAYPILYDEDDPGGGSGDFWTPGHRWTVEYKSIIIKKIRATLVDSDYVLEERTWYVYDHYSSASVKYDGLCVCWGTEEQITKSLKKR